MRKIILAGALALASLSLAACNTDQVNTTVDKTQQAFETACLALPTVHQNFLTIASAFSVKQSVLDAELKAYNAGLALCTSGVVTNTAAAVKSVNSAVSTISNATKQAGG